MLFDMRLPVFGLGLVFVAVATLFAFEWHDRIIGTLAAAAGLLTATRLWTMQAFRRVGTATSLDELKRWELRYAIGTCGFALLLAALNVRALTYHQPLMHLITVSLVFAFGAGVVSRTSVRPRICIASLLLATVPTVAALAAHAFSDHGAILHTQLFAIQALLLAMITILSLQSVGHLYRSAVQHHTTEHDMAHLAKRDALTGLANRLLLRERFQDAAAQALRGSDNVAVHYIDLDGFKAINDHHGHPAGDSLLQQVSGRLEATVRGEDTVARLGGDEFVVLQTGVAQDGEAEMLARRIIKKLSAPYAIDGTSMCISASVGIAIMPDAGRDLETLLSRADSALYRSKNGGKGRAHFCTREDASDDRRAVA
jgi:diguanylate cyclase (GGDEF)-like protein